MSRVEAARVEKSQVTRSPGSLARAEMEQQPAVVRRMLIEQAEAIAAAASLIRRRRPRYAVIAARGSSDNAARYAQHVLGRLCRLPVALATPSLHTIYGTPPAYRDALVIGISQSGESPDVASVLDAAGRSGCVTLAITNAPASPLARAAEHVIELRAGIEASVAATKSYTASLAAVAALAAQVADDTALERQVMGLPLALERQLERCDADAGEVAERAVEWQRLAVVGRGANYATAYEAALKIKELTGAAAEPHSPADFLHGPIAIVTDDFPVLAIAVDGPAAADTSALLDGVRARGGAPALITDLPELARPGEPVLGIARVAEWLSPIVAVLPAQAIAIGAAERLGLDVDQPFGLSKITRTV